MKIILVESDLDQAIRNYVEHLGMNLEGKRVETTFTAGRGVNGNTVTVDIESMDGSDSVSSRPAETQQELPLDDDEETTEEVDTQSDEEVDPTAPLFN